jgi:hypothetical protein
MEDGEDRGEEEFEEPEAGNNEPEALPDFEDKPEEGMEGESGEEENEGDDDDEGQETKVEPLGKAK